jgi:hypothetical protein
MKVKAAYQAQKNREEGAGGKGQARGWDGLLN